MKDYTVNKVAESDGKCFKCGQHCMKCNCWLNGISDPFNLSNQPERSKREDGNIRGVKFCNKCKDYNSLDSLFCRCGALNTMET